jgi:hypothetical protein
MKRSHLFLLIAALAITNIVFVVERFMPDDVDRTAPFHPFLCNPNATYHSMVLEDGYDAIFRHSNWCWKTVGDTFIRCQVFTQEPDPSHEYYDDFDTTILAYVKAIEAKLVGRHYGFKMHEFDSLSVLGFVYRHDARILRSGQNWNSISGGTFFVEHDYSQQIYECEVRMTDEGEWQFSSYLPLPIRNWEQIKDEEKRIRERAWE